MKTTSAILAVVGVLLARAENRSIQKRSDDSNPLIPVVDRLATEVGELKARLDAMDHKVSFLARFSAAHPTAQATSPFRFDQVTLNDGNAFNSRLGVFTAPFTGTYIFSLNIFTYGPQRPLVDIRVDGSPVSRMALDTQALSTNGEDSDSMTVILRLAHGDRVWVEVVFDQVTLWGSIHSFFTGALLYAA